MKFYKLVPIKKEEYETKTGDTKQLYLNAEQSMFWVGNTCYIAVKPDAEINIDLEDSDDA